MKIYLTALLVSAFFNLNAQDYFMLVGTYDSPKSEGIYVYRYDSKTGSAVELSHIKTSNPSYLVVSHNEKFVYAVEETAPNDGSGGSINAFAFNKLNGTLTFINKQSSGGNHPCHVEMDKTGKWLFASNYSGGSLSVLPVNEDGSVGKPNTIQHTGSGINSQRQKSSHVHGAYIANDNKQLLVTDLGIDKIVLYDFSAKTGELRPSSQRFARSVPGSGPRSLCFLPNNKKVFVIEELSGSFSTYKYASHKLTAEHRIFTNETGDSSFAGGADIHMDEKGTFLYTSSRGNQNTINVYNYYKPVGLRFVQRQSSLGKSPRNFSIDPGSNFLLCANQNSDEIVVFKRDRNFGTLTDSGQRISIGKPVCIKWINSK